MRLRGETEYQYARVVEDADGDAPARAERGAGDALAVPAAARYLTGDYWDGFLVDAGHRAAARRRARSRSSATPPGRPRAPTATTSRRRAIDAVEIDGELTEIGRRWFGLRGAAPAHASPRTRARSCAAPSERYDAIFVDAYRQPYIPFYLATSEFFELVPRPARRPAAWWSINVGHPEGERRAREGRSRATLRHVVRARRCATRSSRRTRCWSRARRRRRRGALRARGAGAAGATCGRSPREAAARLAPAAHGGEVFTDDRAPVEWLIDASIVKYAAGDG